MRHAHKFERLSDEAIFCACGAIKFVDPSAQCTRPHYPQPWVMYPPYTIPVYYPWWSTTGPSPAITYGEVTVSGTTSYASGDTNVTYTLGSGGAS